MQTEQRICLILDNYSIHKSAFIKKNSTTSQYYINIPSTVLSTSKPIEQIWRQMKREIKHHYLESREFLQELTIKNLQKIDL